MTGGEEISIEINSLKAEYEVAESKCRSIMNHIREIQLLCKHDYEFWCSGVYEDTYICKWCNKEIER
jgi:hypothetical protein